MLGHLLNAVEGLVYLLGALEAERNGDDAHGENVHVLAGLGNDGRGTRTGAAAHAGGDEGHLGAVVEHAADVVDALEGGLAGARRTVSGPETLLAELQVHGHGRVVEGLGVGVAEHERHVVDALAVHVVHGIAAPTTYADDLDDAVLLVGVAEVEDGRLLVFSIVIVVAVV